jgi:flagellar basal body-associated protein FliL
MAESGVNQVLSASDAAQRRKKPRSNTLVIGVVLLCAIGFGAWRTFFRSSPVNPADPAQAPSGTTVLQLESFTVNLADPEEGRFLRTTMSLGVDGKLPPAAKVESREPHGEGVSMATIRDSILTVLAQCKSSDLLRPEGKLKLKADLVNALNRDVPALQTREVYFTEFLVQR